MTQFIKLSALLLVCTVAPGLRAAPRRARALVTSQGTTRALVTPDGRQDVLELDQPNGDGSSTKTYQIVHKAPQGSHRGLEFQSVSPVYTPFGASKLVVKARRLHHEVTVFDRPYRVTARPDGSLEYRDVRGKKFEGAPRVGGHILAPEGLSRTLTTREGRHEVLSLESPGDTTARYRIVKVTGGHLSYEDLYPNETPYGTSRMVESGGRLRDLVELDKVVYDVTRTPAASYVYTGPDGKKHVDAVRVAGNIVTPRGVTRPMQTANGRRDVLTIESRPNDPQSRAYEVVTSDKGSLRYDRIHPISTPFGATSLVEDKGRIVQRLDLHGHRFEVDTNASGQSRYKNERGNVFVGAPRIGGAIATADGIAEKLDTPHGKAEVVVSDTQEWDGTAYVPAKAYTIASVSNGSLDQRRITPLGTPFGATIVSESGRRIVHKLRIRDEWYVVTAGRDAYQAFTFTNEKGTSFQGAPRVGRRIVMPDGSLTEAMQTPAGRHEVTRGKGSAWSPSGQLEEVTTYHTVDPVVGPQSQSQITPAYTQFGQAHLVASQGRLRQEIEIGGKRFEVMDNGTGTLVYRDRRGQSFEGAPRIGGRLYTPQGFAESLRTPDGPRDVVVSERPSPYGETARHYELASVVNGQLRIDAVGDIVTAFGRAMPVDAHGALFHRIKIAGRNYRVLGDATAYSIVDENGKPFRDTWREKLTSKVDWRDVVKSPYRPGLRPIKSGPIVKIDDQSATPTEHMALATYDELRDAMLEAMRLYDPRSHYFVGLGSDPHPIIAFLQNIGGTKLATNFPASGKYSPGMLVPSTLEPYVRKLIPAEVLNGSKTLVLLDQTTSAEGCPGTLAQVSPMFQQYLESIGSPAKVVQLAFSPNPHPEGTGVIDTNKYPEVGKFLSHPYEHVVSQYDRHVLGQNTLEDLVERPGYRAFKTAMLKRMQRDEKLDRFLTQELAVKK